MNKAFTLMELLVVIVIISVLLGLVIVAAGKMSESARASQTRAILAGLNGIASQYEASTHKQVWHLDDLVYAWGNPKPTNVVASSGVGPGASKLITGGLAADESFPTSPSSYSHLYYGGEKQAHESSNLFSERFVWASLQIPDLATRLRGLGPNTLVDWDDDGFLELRDAWGNNIAYVARNEKNGGEDDYLPAHGSPFFSSPGADGLWGAAYTQDEINGVSGYPGGWSGYSASEAYARSQDNLYGYDIDRSKTAGSH